MIKKTAAEAPSEKPAKNRRERREFLRKFKNEKFYRDLLKEYGATDSDDLTDGPFEAFYQAVKKKICRSAKKQEPRE